ncbi:MAG: hypothetical protein WHS77_11045, partial [Brevinematales bacterium]
IANEKQGRIWSLTSTITYFGSIIAFSVAGPLADNVFNPLLRKNGILAETIGKVIGVGDYRGIGLIFILSGIFVSIISVFLIKNKAIRKLEPNIEGGM